MSYRVGYVIGSVLFFAVMLKTLAIFAIFELVFFAFFAFVFAAVTAIPAAFLGVVLHAHTAYLISIFTSMQTSVDTQAVVTILQ